MAGLRGGTEVVVVAGSWTRAVGSSKDARCELVERSVEVESGKMGR